MSVNWIGFITIPPLIASLISGPASSSSEITPPPSSVEESSGKFTNDYLSDMSHFTVISETPVPTMTPTATPTPSPIPFTNADLEKWFDEISSQQSVEKDLLKRIAYCESHLNPKAVNGDYVGLYQFSSNTWEVTRRRMNYDTNPLLRLNALEAIRTAAFKIATDGRHAWPVCSR